MKTILAILLIAFNVSAQEKLNYSTKDIPEELKKNANAVIKHSEVILRINSQNELIEKEHTIITIFNSKADYLSEVFEQYNQDTKIVDLQLRVFNEFGLEIEKIKKNKFEDVSAVGGAAMYTDERAKYYSYTARSYPYTIEITKETKTNTTAFLKPFIPLEHYSVSVMHRSYSVINYTDIKLKIKEDNFNVSYISKEEKSNGVKYIVENLQAIDKEYQSPDFFDIYPLAYFSLEYFNMKGVQGVNTNWKSFGKWMYDELISDVVILSEDAVKEVKSLVNESDSNLEKAKKVYEYMQNKTRYINVAIGIGGWKPDKATNVHNLGYGDCKGLTNYTKAMLDEIGVTSYHTIVFGGEGIRDIDKEFSCAQGNHMILNIPNEDEDLWLECTSQSVPFGFIANFTDDRDVLVVTPEGGEIKHTKIYNASENKQHQKANVIISKNGALKATVNIASRGVNYNNRMYLTSLSEKDKKIVYKNDYSYVNGLEVSKIEILNNKEEITLREKVELSTLAYVQKAGSSFLFAPNIFNRQQTIPPSYSNRKTPLKIQRSESELDEYEIIIPEGMSVEGVSDNIEITEDFGSYKVSIMVNSNSIKYKRELIINAGVYDQSTYTKYRNFIKNIVKTDKSKLVLTFN